MKIFSNVIELWFKSTLVCLSDRVPFSSTLLSLNGTNQFWLDFLTGSGRWISCSVTPPGSKALSALFSGYLYVTTPVGYSSNENTCTWWIHEFPNDFYFERNKEKKGKIKRFLIVKMEKNLYIKKKFHSGKFALAEIHFGMLFHEPVENRNQRLTFLGLK